MLPAPDPTEPLPTDSPAVAADGGKPRVVILADRPDWAHDASALPVSQLLSDEFEVRVEYVSDHLTCPESRSTSSTYSSGERPTTTSM